LRRVIRMTRTTRALVQIYKERSGALISKLLPAVA
jgi:hypothetical protein